MKKNLNCLLLSSALLSALSSSTLANCFDVEFVDLNGVTLLSAENQAQIISEFKNTCMGLGEINALMNRLTAAYIEEGYVTTRAYLPRQDLTTGHLILRVIEGKLEAIRFNKKTDAVLALHAFGRLTGKPLNLRDLEQGLDNIRSMRSYSAEMELSPGSDEGETVLDITTQNTKPWQFTFGINNHGSDEGEENTSAATGAFIDSFGLQLDNPMGRNDVWTLNATKSIADNPLNLLYDGPGTHSLDFGVSVPVGRLSYKANVSYSDYSTYIDGSSGPIELDGWTQTTSLDLRYLLNRGRDRKSYLTFDLERRENQNFVADVLINASSRVLTSARLGFSHERSFERSSLSFGFGLEQGLKLFGAEDFTLQSADQPDAQFTKIDASLDYFRNIPFAQSSVVYKAQIHWQYSGDRLYGNEQFSLGGQSSIRGSKSSVASGSSGVYLRNTFDFPALLELKAFGTLTPYMTFDIGHIIDQPEIDIVGQTVSGLSAGMRLGGSKYSLDLSYGRLLTSPHTVEVPDALFLFSLNTQF